MTGLVSGLALEASRIFARMQFGSSRRRRLYREFAGLLKSGFSRGESLEILLRIASRDGTRPSEPAAIVLADAGNGVRNGLSLADSFKSWIPREDRMLIMAFEDSEGFADHLESWCAALDSQAGIRADALGSLVYPGFLIIAAYALLIYFDARIMPPLEEILPRDQWTGAASLFQTVCSAASEHAAAAAAVSALTPALLLAALPRWSGPGRNQADRLPLFALYRACSGLSFLQAMGTLMASGLSASEAILRIRDGASPYSRTRLDLIRLNLLNGRGLGESMQSAAAGWPDPELSLSMRALAHSPDFPAQILRMAKDWQRVIQQRAERAAAVWRLLSFLAVFGVVSGVVTAMYEIQSQIASNIH